VRGGTASTEIRVTDSARGIVPELLPLVFEPFRQEHPTQSRARGGLGLGLAITQQLVELHGGHVEAHSNGPSRAPRSWCPCRCRASPPKRDPRRPPVAAFVPREISSVQARCSRSPSCRRRRRGREAARSGRPRRVRLEGDGGRQRGLCARGAVARCHRRAGLRHRHVAAPCSPLTRATRIVTAR
jgi:signal transduction histidine kinase